MRPTTGAWRIAFNPVHNDDNSKDLKQAAITANMRQRACRDRTSRTFFPQNATRLCGVF
jgi:hypothetical protein